MSDIFTRIRTMKAEVETFGSAFIPADDLHRILDDAAREIAALRNRVWTGARSDDPDTSKAAAPSGFKLNDSHLELLRAYQQYGALTADMAGEITGMVQTRACYWKRVSELASIGYLEATGDKRPGLAGKLQTVRRLTSLGAAALNG